MRRSLLTLNTIASNCILILAVLLFSTFSVTAAGNDFKESSPRATTPSTTVVSLADYGAIADGVADVGPAMQLALDDLAANGGGTLHVPSGRYRLGTPIVKNFTPGISLEIKGVQSTTVIDVAGNGEGLNLTSEFIVAVGQANDALVLSGLESLLLQDIAFVGVPEVLTDARRVIGLSQIKSATIQHCEFYGLASFVEEGAIISTHLTDLVIAKTAFLGCAANSAVRGSVIQTISWLGLEVRDCKFVDYGNRNDFFSKTTHQPPFSWIIVGNTVELGPAQSRREAIVDNVFLDEGAFLQIAILPELFSAKLIPFEVYLSRLYVNVNNLFSDGVLISRATKVFIDRSIFGWSERAGHAIALHGVGDAVLDLINCSADATRLYASAQRLTVLNSVYTSLESVGPVTRIINTDTPQEDPAQFVRQQYLNLLNRDPDPAGHYYWTEKILRCEEEPQCVSQTHVLLEAFLNTSPTAKFSAQGIVLDEEGMPLPGVSMSLNGSQSAHMETATDGGYSFDKLATAGEYRIKPTKKHYSFEEGSLVTPNSDVVANFTGIRLRHKISGRVVTSGGNPLAGATIVLSGEEEATATSDVNGTYKFNNLPGGGNYTVTVSRQNYAFVVSSRLFDDLSNDVSCDFHGSLLKYAIAGVIKKPDGTPLTGASLELSNGAAASQTTDANGNYSFLVTAEANYTITVRHEPYFFEPPIRSFVNLSQSQRADFQAVNGVVLSGRITNSKEVPVQGVALSLTGDDVRSVDTDKNGNYSFLVRPGGDYTITATKLNYTFNPGSTTINDLTADKLVNFEAILNLGIPVLRSATDPARALALDAVELVAEPFKLSYGYPWSTDHRTRVVFYVENVDLSAPGSNLHLYAELEDSSHRIYPLTVEYAALIAGVPATNRVVVRLNDNLTAGGDYVVRISYRGVFSQPLLIAIATTQGQN